MLLELATNKNSANFIVLFAISLILFFVNTLALNLDITQRLICGLFFLMIVFQTHKLGIYIDLKPGEDLLPSYILLFMSLATNPEVKLIIGDFLIILGLFYVFKILDNDKQLKSTQIANIAFIFALSSLFEPVYIFMILFLAIIVIFYFPKVKFIFSIILVYLTTYYLGFSILYLSKILSLSQIFHYFDFDISFNLFSKINYQVLIYIFIITLLFIASFLHISSNFFKYAVKLRHIFVTLLIFLFLVTLLSLIKGKIFYTQLVSISLLLSFWLLNNASKIYIKDAILLTIVGLSISLLF